MIPVLPVGAHAAARMRCKLALRANHEMKVIDEAPSGAEASRRYAGLLPDVVIMDIAMPRVEGLKRLCRLLTRHPKARVLVLSMHDQPTLASRVLEQGALGFLAKCAAAQILNEAVVAASRGQRYLDPAVAQTLALTQFAAESLPVGLIDLKAKMRPRDLRLR
jgi:two-component system, NarL family, invasion response regulator UvrY